MFQKIKQLFSRDFIGVLFTPNWRWLVSGATIFIFISAFYFSLHSVDDFQKKHGFRTVKLSQEEVSVVSAILSEVSDSASEENENRIHYAFDYILRAAHPVAEDSIKIFSMMNLLNHDKFISILPQLKITTKSFFWLNDDWKYYEVLFWALFGVLINMLYHSSEYMRKNEFDRNEIPVYFAKTFYAPVIAIVLIWGCSYFTTDSFILQDSNFGIIFTAFLLGFASSRAVEILNKVKDVILRGGGKDEGKEEGNISILGKLQTANPNGILKNMEVLLVPSSNPQQHIFATVTKDIYYVNNLVEGTYNISAKCFSEEGKSFSANTDVHLLKSKPNEQIDMVLSDDSAPPPSENG